jgi:hypothetical protein
MQLDYTRADNLSQIEGTTSRGKKSEQQSDFKKFSAAPTNLVLFFTTQ